MLSALVALFAGSLAWAQEAEFSPPCAGPGFARLRSLEGSWRVRWTYRLEPGKYEHTIAHAQIEPVIPKCMLEERFTGTLQGEPFRALALFDTAQSVWVDSNHGQILLFRGGWVADTLAVEWSRDTAGPPLRLRRLLFAVAPDSFQTRNLLLRSSAEGWQVVQEAVYVLEAKGTR